MGKTFLLVVRIALGLALLGALAIQCIVVPLAAIELADRPVEFAYLRISLLSYVVLALAVVQVSAISAWKLATILSTGFGSTAAACRHAATITIAVAAGSLLTFILGSIMAPGPAVAPGLVLLVGGFGLVLAGVALLLWMLRQLLVREARTTAQAGI